jgi:hypothetical protein
MRDFAFVSEPPTPKGEHIFGKHKILLFGEKGDFSGNQQCTPL